MRPIIKRFAHIALAVLMTGIILLLLSVDWIVDTYVSRKLHQLGERYRIALAYNRIHLDGFSKIQVRGLTLIPFDADTLAWVGSVEAGIKRDRFPRLMPLLTGIEAKDLHARIQNRDYELLLNADALILQEDRFTTRIQSEENGSRSEWICDGAFSHGERTLKARLYTAEEKKIPLPYLAYRWDASIRFDTLALEIHYPKAVGGVRDVSGQANIWGLTVHQEHVSPDTVFLNDGSIQFLTHLGSDYIELDSASMIRFNRLDFNPYLRIARDTSWKVTASVNKAGFPADDLFGSLPQGLFSNIEGIGTTGELTYHFLLDLDMGQVDSLTFESTLKARDFDIVDYGDSTLLKMNEPFTQTIIEGEDTIRSFEVGEGNPMYRPFPAVARYLPLAIMQCEDAGFFHHNGFIPSAFRDALIQDIKERRFARGGSTLSMQVVKNVFLNHNKTIARKLEEILIVWLIETQEITSKERMFEIYLNIVEWGPKIFGAAEASHFYFDKEPSELNLSECIFLASIIPKPKYVRGCFDELRLKPYHEDFFQLIINRMLDRQLISPQEAEGVSPDAVIITGPAKEYLLSEDDEETVEEEETLATEPAGQSFNLRR